MTFSTVRLGEVANIKGGKRLPKKHDFAEGQTNHPYIRARDIRNGRITFDDPVYIDENTFQAIQKYTVRKHDICITIVGANVGDVGSVPEFLDGANLTENAVKITNLKGIDNTFLKYALMSDRLQKMMKRVAAGAAQPKLGIYKIRRLEIPNPPLSVQKNIADILKAYDDLITVNERRIALLEEAMHLLYREWFVHLRFPGWEETAVVNGVPEGWEKTTVEEAFEIQGGGTPSTKQEEYWNNGEINWYTPSDLTKNESMFVESSSRKINELGLSKSSAKLFPPYSVMMTSRATIGATAINTTEACTNQGFITCFPNPRLPVYFLYCWIKANVPLFSGIATGATFKEISKGKFRQIEMAIPDARIVRLFQETVEPMGKQILNLQRQNEKLKEARDALLPRLMSGRLAV